MWKQNWEWTGETQDVNEMVARIESTITTVLDTHAPIKNIKTRKYYRKGLTQSTRELMQKRDEVRKLMRTTRDQKRKGSLGKKYRKLHNKTSQLYF